MAGRGSDRVRDVREGTAASSGIGIGRAVVVQQREAPVSEREIEPAALEAEVERFRAAVQATRKEIQEVRRGLGRRTRGPEARILEPLLLMLRDPLVIDETEAAIRRERRSAEFVLDRTMRGFEETIAASPDEYLRERASDLRDLRRRILRQLAGVPDTSAPALPRRAVIVAEDLSPMDTARMRADRVLAIATERGGRTSHGSILARQLEIPAVVGVDGLTRRVKTGDMLVVDGHHGRVIVHPTAADLAAYRAEKARFATFAREMLRRAGMPAVTRDGREIQVMANVAYPEEAAGARRHGARGIGLFRTEFLFLDRPGPPGEEEQREAYAQVLRAIGPDPVTIRTLDLGADKVPHWLAEAEGGSLGPGARGIRLCQARPALFRTQLRALYAAAPNGRLRIMFPMISGVNEFREAARFAREVAAEVGTGPAERPAARAPRGSRRGPGRRRPPDGAPQVAIGTMIETPAAALVARELAREADFFSIGTNDLIQYTVAVDRQDERLAHLFEPLHPGVLRLIRNVVEAAAEARIPVAVCGEMSADPLSTLVLLGLGVSELSVGAAKIPEIKRIIRSVRYAGARRFAQRCLEMADAEEVRGLAKAELDARFWGQVGLA